MDDDDDVMMKEKKDLTRGGGGGREEGKQADRQGFATGFFSLCVDISIIIQRMH